MEDCHNHGQIGHTMNNAMRSMIQCLAGLSFLLFLVLVPEMLHAGVPSMKLDMRAAPSPGRLVAVSTATNNGGETAYNVSIMSSLAGDTRRSDPLGDVHAGKRRSQRVEFSLEGLKPGRYILAARLDYHEQNGMPHRIHSFRAFRVSGSEPEMQNAQETRETAVASGIPAMAEMPGLSVALEIPAARWTLFGNAGTKIVLIVKNRMDTPIRPVFSIHLPGGVTADRTELQLEMGPGEERREEVRLDAKRSVRGGHPVSVLVSCETEEEYDSRLLRTTLSVEENSMSLPAMAMVAIILTIALAAFVLIAFRRSSTGHTGEPGT